MERIADPRNARLKDTSWGWKIMLALWGGGLAQKGVVAPYNNGWMEYQKQEKEKFSFLDYNV